MESVDWLEKPTIGFPFDFSPLEPYPFYTTF